ncbi:Heat shock protein beta-1 [Folsomia candida]|uniref:Heat shock protein beta-1 n=1 Tax=Folsomia candida TaxID=158441 RepID=A0A226D0K9_FOLCA|nr:Heat shock protein beta-1 [Folsomia candida]
MSVENYDLEELSIRTEDGQILVVGKQRKENHAKDAALRSFTRKIAIPEGMEGAGLKWEQGMGSGQWAVVSGEKNGQWAVVSGQWGKNGQWAVGSGEKMGSGQWAVGKEMGSGQWRKVVSSYQIGQYCPCAFLAMVR